MSFTNSKRKVLIFYTHKKNSVTWYFLHSSLGVIEVHLRALQHLVTRVEYLRRTPSLRRRVWRHNRLICTQNYRIWETRGRVHGAFGCDEFCVPCPTKKRQLKQQVSYKHTCKWSSISRSSTCGLCSVFLVPLIATRASLPPLSAWLWEIVEARSSHEALVLNNAFFEKHLQNYLIAWHIKTSFKSVAFLRVFSTCVNLMCNETFWKGNARTPSLPHPSHGWGT